MHKTRKGSNEKGANQKGAKNKNKNKTLNKKKGVNRINKAEI